MVWVRSEVKKKTYFRLWKLKVVCRWAWKHHRGR